MYVAGKICGWKKYGFRKENEDSTSRFRYLKGLTHF